MMSSRQEHIERIRQKANVAEGLGPFWRGILLSALDCIDAERKLSDSYGLGLMMIREGCAEPAKFAGEILGKNDPNGERATVALPEECAFCGQPTTRTWNFGGKGGWDVCEACANLGECDNCHKQNVARRVAGPILACEECQS